MSDDLQFRYAVRAALGMNDKCGLTGLEHDVAEVHRIALRLRAALQGLVSKQHGHSALCECPWCEARAALADAQFPRLWEHKNG